MKHQDALDQLARETARAGRRIALERALRAGFWLLVAIGVWAVLALVGAHDALPLLAQSLSSIAALIAFGWLALRARRAWRKPTTDEARRRLAADSALDDGAFATLEDQPTRYDAFSIALWKREITRALQKVENLRAGPTRPHLDDLDRYRLRYVLAGLLVIGLVIAGAQAPDRLARAFLPDPGPLLGDREMAIEAWVTPAEYTRESPVSLTERIGQNVSTPPSVEATVRITGPVGAPWLVYNGRGGHREARFVRAADGAWEAKLRIPGAGQLKIVRFHTRATWRITPANDAAPTAAFTAPMVAAAEEHAVISWSARDDFGVRGLYLRVRPVNPPEGLARADAVDTELESPAGDPREAQDESTVDVAPHPYAGMEVEARLVAVDALGQEGVSEPMRFTMPEKVFLQPLARAAIEIRRHVLAERRPYRGEREPRMREVRDEAALYPQSDHITIRDYDRRPALNRAPEGIRRATRLLDALMMAPEDGYFRDLAVYLGFRLARSELAASETINDTNLAADTLWRTALRAEYGGAADARRALEEAQRQLAEALQQGAPPERINQLLEALRRATDAYMQALVQEAMRNGERQNMEDTEDQTTVSGQDIQDMLNQVQRLSEQGRTAEAQQMLQQLANILQNLDVQLDQAQSGQEGEQGEQGEQSMQQSMDQLSQSIGEQRELNSDTQQQQQEQRQSQGGSGGNQQGGMGGDDLAQRQQEIREALAQAQNNAQGMGQASSQSLNNAQQAMRESENALRQGDLEGARAAQQAALDQLREGAEALAAEMRENGREGGQQQGERGGRRDPLGRDATGGAGDNGEANVPSQSDPVRARAIYDEIRRRAGEADRPETERDYLRRLLDRFGDS